MEALERLAAIEEISSLKARYFLAVDMQDWDLMRRKVFIEETSFQFSEFREEPFYGQETVLNMFADALVGKVTVHHGHMPVIELSSDTTAKGLWAMEDRIYQDGPGALLESRPVLHGFGHYHETYVKRPEGWRIETIRLTRLRLETRTIA